MCPNHFRCAWVDLTQILEVKYVSQITFPYSWVELAQILEVKICVQSFSWVELTQILTFISIYVLNIFDFWQILRNLM